MTSLAATFGVEQVVDAHVDEHLLVVGFQVFVVVDAGDGFPRPELLASIAATTLSFSTWFTAMNRSHLRT